MLNKFVLLTSFKMACSRHRWRKYKTVALMFLLTVLMLSVFHKDILGTKGTLASESNARIQGEIKPSETREEQIVTRSWDINSTNCSINTKISSLKGFANLDKKVQQFLLYKHCRYFPMIINHPEKCSGDVHLLIVIKSIISQHNRRKVIRQTWGKEQVIDGKRIKLLFLLGMSSNKPEKTNHQKLLEYEDYIYGDILQWDFMDTFFNLTLKEIHFLKWFSTYCDNVPYIFKGDDDVFVSVTNILDYLKSSKRKKDLFAGDVVFKAKPIRKKQNKYYIPHLMYKKRNYPSYAGGGGFLMAGPLARRLHVASEKLDLYPIDDVFLGMCLEVLKVTPIKHNAFKTFYKAKKEEKRKLKKEPCFYKNRIVVHKFLPRELLDTWHSHVMCKRNVQWIK